MLTKTRHGYGVFSMSHATFKRLHLNPGLNPTPQERAKEAREGMSQREQKSRILMRAKMLEIERQRQKKELGLDGHSSRYHR
jgi:hypothetical protein